MTTYLSVTLSIERREWIEGDDTHVRYAAVLRGPSGLVHYLAKQRPTVQRAEEDLVSTLVQMHRMYS